jgi:PAS domain S-box-containing protein
MGRRPPGKARPHLREGDFVEAVLETVGALIVVLDADGRIIAFNRECERVTGWSFDEVAGEPFWERFLPADEQPGVRGVFGRLTSGEFPISYENDWLTRGGDRRRIAWSNTAILEPDGAVRAIVATGIDVTVRRQAEVRARQADAERVGREMAEAAEAEIRRTSTFLGLLQHVAVAANEASSLEEALAGVVREVCVRTGWYVGHAHVADRGAELAPTDIWHLDTPDAAPVFRDVTARTRFRRGEGVVGQVLESGTPAWIEDIRLEPGFIRAREPGIEVRSAMIIPVLAGRDVAAVLEFFRPGPSPPDATLLEVAGHIGTQLGRVAERARSERLLRASRARFSGIVAVAVDAIISTDEAMRIILFNEGAEAIFGYRAEEVIGQPLERLMPERFRGSHARLMAAFGSGPVQARRMGERREIRGLRRDGEEFPAEASISRLEIEDERIYTVVLRDVSERRRAEESQRFLSDATAIMTSTLEADAILGGLARLTAERLGEWCVLYSVEDDGSVPRVAFSHVDPDREELGDRALGEYLEGAWEHPLLRALRTGEPELVARLDREELASIAGDAESLDAWRAVGADSLLAVPLRARDRTFGVLGIGAGPDRRPYDQRDLELAIELARRAALALDNARLYRRARAAVLARDEVLSVVSHDLGNPLAAIIMAAEMALRSRPAPADAMRANLDAIRTSADQMERLIQDLLEIRRMEVGQLELRPVPVDPTDALHVACRVLMPLAAVKRIQLESDVPAGTPRVLADRGRLNQILSNLIGNALKFTPNEGRIDVSVREADGEVRFQVADTGPGIPAEQLARVFDRFWQARSGGRTRGIGLGLAIARGLVEAHGGRIGVSSDEGSGATFWFTLPAA